MGMSFAIDVAREVGIPIFYFRTISACAFWAYYCIPEIIDAGELPIRGTCTHTHRYLYRYTHLFAFRIWKLGLDIKDLCDRKIAEKLVNDLLEERREEFTKSADRMANLASISINEGGSSYCNLDHLINDIKMVRSKS